MVVQRIHAAASALAPSAPSWRPRVVPWRPQAPKLSQDPIDRGPDLTSAIRLAAVAESLGVTTLAVGDERGPWIALGYDGSSLFRRAQAGCLPQGAVVERWSTAGRDALLTARAEPMSLAPLAAEVRTTAPVRRASAESGIFLRQTTTDLTTRQDVPQAEFEEVFSGHDFDECFVESFASNELEPEATECGDDALERELEEFFLSSS